MIDPDSAKCQATPGLSRPTSAAVCRTRNPVAVQFIGGVLGQWQEYLQKKPDCKRSGSPEDGGTAGLVGTATFYVYGFWSVSF